METIKGSGSHALLTCSHIIFILSLTNITGRAPYGVVQLVGNKCDSDLYPLLAVFTTIVNRELLLFSLSFCPVLLFKTGTPEWQSVLLQPLYCDLWSQRRQRWLVVKLIVVLQGVERELKHRVGLQLHLSVYHKHEAASVLSSHFRAIAL